MRFSVDIADKHLLLILSTIAVLSVIGIAIAQTPPDPGHDPGEIGPGTFGSGNYIFPNDLDVQGDLDVSGSADITGDLSVGGSITGTLVFSCPPGFTAVQSQGKVIGCIQDTEEGNTDWHSALKTCSDTYGGRLPFSYEWYLGMDQHELTDETDDWEWLADQSYPNYHSITGYNNIKATSWRSDSSPATLYTNYRCWIPA